MSKYIIHKIAKLKYGRRLKELEEVSGGNPVTDIEIYINMTGCEYYLRAKNTALYRYASKSDLNDVLFNKFGYATKVIPYTSDGESFKWLQCSGRSFQQ
jgi:hypothetical protein